MIRVDLHSHTKASHGRDSVADMALAAAERGLAVFGFSEHSPRPLGYDYPSEYREHLNAAFPTYLAEVRALRQGTAPGGISVRLGLEMDWLEAEPSFMTRVVQAEDYDYVIGGVHFLGTWGFDAAKEDWDTLTDAGCHANYAAYFATLAAMGRSGLVQIAAHPDIIKLFSVNRFRAWLEADAHLDQVRDALVALRDNGVAMEISSAGLRKPCHEIYPGPRIMRLAADLGLAITFGSDAHSTEQVAQAFDQLAAYAHSFGYTHSRVFTKGESRPFPFV